MTIEIRNLSIKSSVADSERGPRGNDDANGGAEDPGIYRDPREDGEWRAVVRRQWQELLDLKQER
jgi:hypothetical protein